ncbi:Response regulator receiver domain-containing protein [Syntrophus gentianae]|uniref:Response regulator receiver domain-containing protein n=2 Tax=Syntrophus gentianae TaxID=43775 RepID=A0A1H7ZYV7_9BACT|nr:Response regulator receiver domain-containing protein [Syntrophus gentianae]
MGWRWDRTSSFNSSFSPLRIYMKKTGKLILVVDDDPNLRLLLAIHLEKAGFQTIEASNGVKALQLLQDHKPDLVPDLIVTDAVMPRLDGHGLIREVRSEPAFSRIPLILLTGNDGGQAVGNAFRPDAYQKKPFVFSDLLAKVETLLSKA